MYLIMVVDKIFSQVLINSCCSHLKEKSVVKNGMMLKNK